MANIEFAEVNNRSHLPRNRKELVLGRRAFFGYLHTHLPQRRDVGRSNEVFVERPKAIPGRLHDTFFEMREHVGGEVFDCECHNPMSLLFDDTCSNQSARHIYELFSLL